MQKNSGKIKALHVIFAIFVVAAIGVSGYLVYDYERTKKINATIVTPSDAKSLLRLGLAQ